MAILKNTIINSTESIRLPVGTTGQRPGSPTVGMLRYNSTDSRVEIFTGSAWAQYAVSGGGLYAFTTATFTPGGPIGRSGPSLAQARAGLSGSGTDAWKNDTAFFNTSNGIQLWTVPANGNYRIEAFGASGGDNPSAVGQRGLGARMRGDFALASGEIIRILVGQRGRDHASSSHAGSGGGGTYVVRTPYNTNGSILVIAGGGGGGGNVGSDVADAVTSNNGVSASSGSGGTSGNGGSAGSASPPGGGGGGFFSSGGDAPGVGGAEYGRGGQGFIQGGVGGLGNNTSGYAGDGGFGGGGSGYGGGGGGGGYGGGGGGQWSPGYYGGGGGSFNNGSNQSNTAATRDGDGQVIITLL